MKGFIEGKSRSQSTLFLERFDDYISEDSTVRVIDVFIVETDDPSPSEPSSNSLPVPEP